MKKFFFFLLFVVLFCCSLIAQDNILERSDSSFYFLKKDKALNLGVGLLNAQSFSFSLFEANGSGNPSPSIGLSYEYGLTDNISIAGFGSFYRVEAEGSLNLGNIADQIAEINLEDLGSIFSSVLCIINPSACANETTQVKERVSVFTIGGKLRYHRNFLPQLDTYASSYLGYSFNRRKTITEMALDAGAEQLGLGIEVPTFVYYASIGARYFITEQIGVFGEYGVGNVHLLKVGATYRME